MTEQLNNLLDRMSGLDNQQLLDLGVLPFVTILLVSLASALFIGWLYLQFYSSRASGSQVYRAFPLLGLSITAIFICIQFSLPLSLGLLGALSIVRFRTPIKEPEEIGFIMLVIATSLACATFNMVFLVVILAVALLALVIRRFASSRFTGGTNDGALILALPEEEYARKKADLLAFLSQRLPRAKIDSISSNESEMVVSVSFRSMPPKGLAAFEDELREKVTPSSFTILYNRPGAL